MIRKGHAVRIPTTHVGSLPRPAEMIRRQGSGQDLSAKELAGFVRAIVERQQSLGLSLINNGELPRADYVSATVRRIRGFDGSADAPLPRDLEEVPEYARRFNSRNGLITLNPKAPVRLPACSSELVYAGEESLRGELDMLTGAFAESRSRFPGSEVALFFTAPSPGTIALFLANSYYPSYRSYLERLGEVLSREYQIIHSYGVHLQVDCPDLAMGRHTAHKQLSDEEFLAIAELNIDVLNQALSGIDPERCRAHVCWGNYPGTHHCDIELARIYPAIMRLKPRYLSLEASNHRHAHEGEIFRRLPFPKDKVLMPGVIDTSSNTVEHPELVAQRLLGFASALGPERVVGCTDCGFATTAAAASVSGEVAWMKLASLVEGANLAGRRV
jgi:5-methyltetrahydropteroyltriglutamate--homocysteine methyltransferase